MKLLIFMLAAVFTVSCSSKKKEEAPAPQPTSAQEEPAKVEEPVKTEAEAPAPAPSSSSELPMIEGDSLMDVNCALGRDQRTISLLKRTDATGWGVVYEKFGEKKTIAVARNDKSFCDEVVGRVKSNLQSAGFQCDGEGASSEAPASGDSSSAEAEAPVAEATESTEPAEKAPEATTETPEGE